MTGVLLQIQKLVRSMLPVFRLLFTFVVFVCCLNEVRCSIIRETTVSVGCPRVVLPPNAPPQTYFPIQWVKEYDTRHNTSGARHCCVCNPGEYLDRICSVGDRRTTVCKPCPPGTYITDFAHTRRTCTPENRTCPVGKVFIPSRPDKASRCDCRKGSHLSEDEKQCVAHTPCKPGYGVKVNPSATRDTECEECLHGYGSLNESHEEKCKRLILPKEPQTTASINIELPTINLQNITDFATSTTTLTEIPLLQPVIEKQSLTIALAIGIPLSFIIVIIVVISGLVYKRHYATKNMSKPQVATDEERPLNEPSGFVGRPMNAIEGRVNEARDSPLLHSRNDEIKGNNSSVYQIMEMSNPAFLPASTSSPAEPHSSGNNDKEIYKTKMKRLRQELSAVFLMEGLSEFYRYFAEKFTDNNVDQMMEDLRNKQCGSRERARIALARLMDLGEENFNPQLIYNYFKRRSETKYSTMVEKYL